MIHALTAPRTEKLSFCADVLSKPVPVSHAVKVRLLHNCKRLQNGHGSDQEVQGLVVNCIQLRMAERQACNMLLSD